MQTPGIHIVGMGASTPIGRNIWASTAAARAGICGFSEHPFMIDTAGEPMCVARAPWLDVDIEEADRFCALLLPAIDESLQPLLDQSPKPSIRMGLNISLPPPRPGHTEKLREDVMHVASEMHATILSHSASFPVGHAGGYLALHDAMTRIHHNSLDACIVAGVDSYLSPETLEWLEEWDQLHGAGPLNNAWGFIPGEAAGAILIMSEDQAQKHCFESLGKIVHIGLGRETNLIKSGNVCIGEGLSNAFRAALELLPTSQQVHNIFCDLNGETYRSDEFGFAALRCKDRFFDASDFIAPAEYWGDIGAASALLHIAQSAICYRKRYGKGDLSMTWASSESGERGAAVIQAFDPQEKA